ncbi:30S ribosomal protein S8 [Mycobacterium kansasii]|uniref:30S ribosomal protein S8 n=1 Tax=Mycobacterium kansasii TaxID=1768 RepID=UPI0034A0AF02
MSKPGLRVYAKSTNLPRVLGGLVWRSFRHPRACSPTVRAARQGVGGEVLAYVW